MNPPMFLQQKISKKPVAPRPKHPKKHKRDLQEHQNLTRCEFKVIPSSTKFAQYSPFYYLYGDIVLAQRNDKIYSDLSFLTKCKEFRSVEVTKISSSKLVQVTLDRKENFKLTPWREIVYHFELTGNPNLGDWAQAIKIYCTNYENFIQTMRQRNNKASNDDLEDKELTRITKETEKKKFQLLDSYPCIYLKTQFGEEDGIQIQEISFNMRLLGELGHSQESFVTAVFQEGIPQILSTNIEADGKAMKMLLNNYFTMDKDGLVTPESEHTLFMKSSYSKRVSVQTHFLLNYQDGKFGMDTIYVIKSISEAILDYNAVPKKVLREEFLQERMVQEYLQADFLNLYYNASFDLRFTHIDKVCKIRELPLVKEEYFYYEE